MKGKCKVNWVLRTFVDDVKINLTKRPQPQLFLLYAILNRQTNENTTSSK